MLEHSWASRLQTHRKSVPKNTHVSSFLIWIDFATGLLCSVAEVDSGFAEPTSVGLPELSWQHLALWLAEQLAGAIAPVELCVLDPVLPDWQLLAGRNVPSESAIAGPST